MKWKTKMANRQYECIEEKKNMRKHEISVRTEDWCGQKPS